MSAAFKHELPVKPLGGKTSLPSSPWGATHRAIGPFLQIRGGIPWRATGKCTRAFQESSESRAQPTKPRDRVLEAMTVKAPHT